MPQRRTSSSSSKLALYGALGAAVVVGGGLIVTGLRSKSSKTKSKSKTGGSISKGVAKGRLVCPYEKGLTPSNPQLVAVNDFVILHLASADMAYSESVWGHVLSRRPGSDEFYVELATPLVKAGLKPILTEKHGFYVGEKLKVSADCIYDVLHKGDAQRYEILCGVMLANHGYEGLPKAALSVKKGDIVTLLVGNPGATPSAIPGQTWNEPVRVYVTSLGKTGSVLHGLVWGDLEHGDQHGLQRFSKLDFTRDCIVKG